MDREGIEVAYCKHCGGPLKCATIAFGQSLPQEVLEKSFSYARNCDLFLTIGSSLVVQPAASLPLEAETRRRAPDPGESFRHAVRSVHGHYNQGERWTGYGCNYGGVPCRLGQRSAVITRGIKCRQKLKDSEDVREWVAR